MSRDTQDLFSLLETVDAYVRTRVALYTDFPTLLSVESAAQHRARGLLAGVGFEGAMDESLTVVRPAGGAAPVQAPTFAVEDQTTFDDQTLEDKPVELTPIAPEPDPEPVSDRKSVSVEDFGDLDFDLGGDDPEPEAPAAEEPEDVEELDVLEDLDVLDDLEPVEVDPVAVPAAVEADDDLDLDIDLDLDLPEEETVVDVAVPVAEEPALDELSLDDLDLDLGDDGEEGDAPFPSTFTDDADDDTILDTAPAPLEPLPELDFEDEDVSDPETLGDPDETEDLLREPEFGGSPEPTFLMDDDNISEPRELADMEIEEPGEDALITIEDTSDPRSDLEGLSRLSDSDLDDDPDTANDEVVFRTTEQSESSFGGAPESDYSPDDEETFVADLADIEKMKAKMAAMEDVADDASESEVLLPPPEPASGEPKAAAAVGAPRVAAAPVLAGPRAAAAPQVAGVRPAGAVAGVRAGGQVTSGLYGNPSVPQIRDRNAPKPRAAAIQIDAAQEQASAGGASGPLLEEDEVLELGSSEDYGEEEVDGPAGFGLDVQEYEDEAAYEDEDDDVDLEEVEEAPQPVFDETVDPAEMRRLVAQAEKALDDGDMELAINLYSDVLDVDYENAEVRVARGRLYLDYGDYSRAMSDFMLADEFAPGSPEPQIAVGDLYFASKEYSRAIGHFNDALKMDPNHAMAFCRRGISHYYRKRFSEALADLNQAQKLDSDIPNIRTYIALAKKKAKR